MKLDYSKVAKIGVTTYIFDSVDDHFRKFVEGYEGDYKDEWYEEHPGAFLAEAKAAFCAETLEIIADDFDMVVRQIREAK